MSETKAVCIIAHPHPFVPSHRVMREQEAGKTLNEIVGQVVPHSVGRPVVFLDGELVPGEAWGETIPGAGAHVLIKVLPAGAQGVNKASGWAALGGIGLIIGGLAVGIFGSPAAWGLAGGLIKGGFGLLGFSILGGIASGELYKAEHAAATTADAARDKGGYSLRGGRNQMLQWGKVPVVLGKHLIAPPMAMKPFSVISGTDGADFHLSLMYCVGHAPMRLSNFKLGENLLASNAAGVTNGAVAIENTKFAGASLEILEGATSTGYNTCTTEENLDVELKYNEPTWRTTKQDASWFSLDVVFPNGLYEFINSRGLPRDFTVSIEVRTRPVGSALVWAACTLVQRLDLTRGKTDVLRFGASGAVSGAVEIGIMRVTDVAKSRSYQSNSLCRLTAFRSIVHKAPVSSRVLPGLTMVKLTLKATKDLSGVVDQFSCIAEASLPVYSGSGTTAASWAGRGYSSNPAAVFLSVLRGPANGRPAPDSSIDWPVIAAWYTTCQSKGWTCNVVIGGGERLRDLLQKIAQTGRASLVMRDGKYSVVVDEPKTVIAQHWTPKNVRSFAWTKAFAEPLHGVKINFISAPDGYAPNERRVYADGYTEANATNLQQVDLWGVTDPGLAWKHARYLMAVAALRPEAFSFETDAESIVNEPGDLVVVSHDAILVGIVPGARIKSVTTGAGGIVTGVVLDEPCRMEAGKSYAIRIRRTSTGESIYRTVHTTAGEYYTLSLSSSIPAASAPLVGDLVTFGEAGIETMRCIVAGIETLEDLGARVYVVPEGAGVHTADSGTIPTYQSNVSQPAPFDPGVVVENVEDIENARRDREGQQYAETRYMRSATAPSVPDGDDPEGWTVQVPADNPDVPLWMSIAMKEGGGRLIGTWSPPVRFTSASPIVPHLSNEEHAVPCDMNGNNCNFYGAETRLFIFEGAQDTTNTFQLGYEASSGITVDAAYFNTQKIVRITAMSEDSAFVDLTGIRSGVTVRKRFNVHKARQGDPAPVYQLQADQLLIPVKPDGRMTQTVRFDATYRAGMSAPQPYAGILKMYVNDLKQYETPVPQSAYTFEGFDDIILTDEDIILTDEDIILPFEYQYQPGNEAQTMRVELWNAENTVKLDSQSVVFMADFENYVPAITEGAPRYLGKYPNTSQPSKYAAGQAWLLYGTTDTPIQRGVWLWDGTQFKRLVGDGTDAQNFYFAEALPDILWAIKSGQGTSADYGHVVFLENLAVGLIATNKIVIGKNHLDQTVIDSNGILAPSIKVGAAQVTGKLTADQIDVNTLLGKDAEFKGRVVSEDGHVAVLRYYFPPNDIWPDGRYYYGLFISSGDIRSPGPGDNMRAYQGDEITLYTYNADLHSWLGVGAIGLPSGNRGFSADGKGGSLSTWYNPDTRTLSLIMNAAITAIGNSTDRIDKAYIDEANTVTLNVAQGAAVETLNARQELSTPLARITDGRFSGSLAIPTDTGLLMPIRFNMTTRRLEYYTGSAWVNVDTGL